MLDGLRVKLCEGLYVGFSDGLKEGLSNGRVSKWGKTSKEVSTLKSTYRDVGISVEPTPTVNVMDGTFEGIPAGFTVGKIDERYDGLKEGKFEGRINTTGFRDGDILGSLDG